MPFEDDMNYGQWIANFGEKSAFVVITVDICNDTHSFALIVRFPRLQRVDLIDSNFLMVALTINFYKCFAFQIFASTRTL